MTDALFECDRENKERMQVQMLIRTGIRMRMRNTAVEI